MFYKNLKKITMRILNARIVLTYEIVYVAVPDYLCS